MHCKHLKENKNLCLKHFFSVLFYFLFFGTLEPAIVAYYNFNLSFYFFFIIFCGSIYPLRFLLWKILIFYKNQTTISHMYKTKADTLRVHILYSCRNGWFEIYWLGLVIVLMHVWWSDQNKTHKEIWRDLTTAG